MSEVPQDGLLVDGVSNEKLTRNAFGQALDDLQHFAKSVITVPQNRFRHRKPYGIPDFQFIKIHPKRLKKLTLDNDVRATRAEQLGYPYAWLLKKALYYRL